MHKSQNKILTREKINMVWNEDKTHLLAQSLSQKVVETITRQYFAHSTMQVSFDKLQIVQEALLNVETESLDVALLLLLQIANEVLDSESLIMAKACAEQKSPFVCTKGCCGCCHQLVLCTPLEAKLILAFLEENVQTKMLFLQNWVNWDTKAKDISISYLAWGQAFYGEGKDDGSHKREDYNIPCPFLDDSKACSIYSVRPYACRSSVSVDKRCLGMHESETAGMYNMLFSIYTGHHKARQRLLSDITPKNNHMQTMIMPTMVWQFLQTKQ